MDERQWLECADPQPMLDFWKGRAIGRKLRLFVCACCRHIWHKLTDQRGRRAVEIAERLADGHADSGEATAVRAEIGQLLRVKEQQLAEESQVSEAAFLYGHLDLWPLMLAESAVGEDVATGRIGYAADFRAEGPADCKPLAEILRDIFGNPFRPLSIDPRSLAWDRGVVRQLAQAAYDQRLLPSGILDPGRLAVLADALEESGCSDPAVLDHLRRPGPHYRGCHLVDALLEKE